MKRVFILVAFVSLSVVGCAKNQGSQTREEQNPAQNSAKQAQSEGDSTSDDEPVGHDSDAGTTESTGAATDSEQAQAESRPSCDEFIRHMEAISESNRDDDHETLELLLEGCSKADNLDDYQSTVDCMMAAESRDVAGRCKGQKQMFREWVNASSGNTGSGNP